MEVEVDCCSDRQFGNKGFRVTSHTPWEVMKALWHQLEQPYESVRKYLYNATFPFQRLFNASSIWNYHVILITPEMVITTYLVQVSNSNIESFLLLLYSWQILEEIGKALHSWSDSWKFRCWGLIWCIGGSECLNLRTRDGQYEHQVQTHIDFTSQEMEMQNSKSLF